MHLTKGKISVCVYRKFKWSVGLEVPFLLEIKICDIGRKSADSRIGSGAGARSFTHRSRARALPLRSLLRYASDCSQGQSNQQPQTKPLRCPIY